MTGRARRSAWRARRSGVSCSTSTKPISRPTNCRARPLGTIVRGRSPTSTCIVFRRVIGPMPQSSKTEILSRPKAGPENFTPSAQVPGRFCTALQFAGDVVIVPPKSWHQTYAPEPSCAVASQFCGRRDAPTVYPRALARHVRCRHRSAHFGETTASLDLARTAPPRQIRGTRFVRCLPVSIRLGRWSVAGLRPFVLHFGAGIGRVGVALL